jgi:hypothetical protein
MSLKRSIEIALGLLLFAVVMIIAAVVISKGASSTTAPATDYSTRFAFEKYEPSSTQCFVHVITDKKTGCQYLQVCNDITAMPHTCDKDK